MTDAAMGTERRDIETILCEAVEIKSVADREAFLDRECGDDSGLRERVDKLIAAHFKAGDFLEQPAAHFDAATELPPLNEGPGAARRVKR